MKKKLLIDLDEVICESGYLPLLNKYLKTNYTVADFDTYYFDDIIKDEEEKIKLNEYYLNHNLYDYAVLLPDVKETLEKLNDKYDIYICSACICPYLKEKAGRIFVDKYDFLIKNFPFLKPENFIFTNAKNIIQADVQIDDRLINLRNDIPVRLLFTSYHNKVIKDDYLKSINVTRVDSWLEIAKLLIKE